jgi:DNA-binding SARP family transcriptional activator/type II secretory pathway predicted ATPase ExeA
VAFARLLLERERGTTRDGLADVVWPDQLPRTWGSALRSLVSRLRAFLVEALPFPPADQPLVAQGGRYLLRLPDDVVVDIEQAELSIIEAQEALGAGNFEAALRLGSEGAECLRAPFLPGHDGPWVAIRRDHLAELLLTALETASRAAAALRDTTRALVLAEEATTLAPLRESSHRCRMAAHAAAGNRGEALRAYQELRRLLAEELGVDPAPDTEAAYLELLGAAPPALASASSGRRAGSRPEVVVPFVDRGVEMATVEDAWASAVQARRQLLYITGEAGVGKTRLVKEVGHRIAVDGGLVLFGRCDRDSMIAYQPFVEALDGYVASSPPEELAALSSLARSELAALFPKVDGPLSSNGQPSMDGSETPANVFGAVTELVAHTSRQRPMLLLFDDLHWANRDTLCFLRHLLRHTPDSRLLVIGTARDDVAAGQPLVEVTYGLERDGLLSRLPLGGLDHEAIRALVDKLQPGLHDDAAADSLAQRLLSATAGNPLMVLELLGRHDLLDLEAATVPRGIHDLVSAKLGATPNPEVERLLHAAAVAGSSFELDVAARAAQLDLPTALDALDAALLVGLVVEADTKAAFESGVAEYRFRHEVARWSLSGQLSAARRNHLRGRVAEANTGVVL